MGEGRGRKRRERMKGEKTYQIPNPLQRQPLVLIPQDKIMRRARRPLDPAMRLQEEILVVRRRDELVDASPRPAVAVAKAVLVAVRHGVEARVVPLRDDDGG